VKGHHEFDHAFSMPCLTKEEVGNVIGIGEKLRSERALLFDTPLKGRFGFLTRRSRIAWLPPDMCRSVYAKVFQAMESINDEHWGIEFDSLQVAQYTVYGPFCHYASHMDLANGLIGNRKLSASVNLTDPSEFVGGRLFAWRGEPSQELGHITVFPAYLIHGVKPVWWGTRISLVFWATGRPFS
jgi:PKHD-type hydroxylase